MDRTSFKLLIKSSVFFNTSEADKYINAYIKSYYVSLKKNKKPFPSPSPKHPCKKVTFI